MLKKYIQIFLESSSLQLSNTIAKANYLDVAKEIEDQQRIKDLEAKKQRKNTDSRNTSDISPEEYSNMLNFYNNNRIARNYLFNQKRPKKKT
jgi:hypothetical protein